MSLCSKEAREIGERSPSRFSRSTHRPALVFRWLLILLVAASMMQAAYASAPPPAPSPAPTPASPQVRQAPAEADRDLLDHVLRDGQVETEAPRPSVSRYLGDLGQAMTEGFVGWLSSLGNVDEVLATVVRWLLIALSATLIALLLWRLFQALDLRRPTPRETSELEVLSSQASFHVDWLAELRTRLDAGEAAGALEALWWWLATRLGLDQVEAGCTTRELAMRAGRRDLIPAMRRFDHLLYSGRLFAVADVRQLWQHLAELLPHDGVELGEEATP